MDNCWGWYGLILFIELFGERKMKLYETNEIERIKNDLLNGEIVAFGTDTVFGLACVYDNPKAIQKVYDAKNREARKALPMMCKSVDIIKGVAYVSDDAYKIMKAFMPGAITIIYKKRPCISDLATSGMDTIGIRIPNDDFVLSLLREVEKPLLVTSANISNEPSELKWEEVYKKLDGRIDGIVKRDASGSSSSTIVDCSGEEIKILRQGPISEKEIREVIQ